MSVLQTDALPLRHLVGALDSIRKTDLFQRKIPDAVGVGDFPNFYLLQFLLQSHRYAGDDALHNQRQSLYWEYSASEHAF